MKSQQWKVTFYTIPTGDSPVEKFIDSVDEKARVILLHKGVNL